MSSCAGKLRERQTRLQCTDCSGASPQLLFDNNLLDGLPPAVAAAAETGHVAAGMNKAEWSEMITRLQQTTTRNSSLLICSSHKVSHRDVLEVVALQQSCVSVKSSCAARTTVGPTVLPSVSLHQRMLTSTFTAAGGAHYDQALEPSDIVPLTRAAA